VDNSGADVILGILPFARELLRCGTQVLFSSRSNLLSTLKLGGLSMHAFETPQLSRICLEL
jgi:hypothetical protein